MAVKRLEPGAAHPVTGMEQPLAATDIDIRSPTLQAVLNLSRDPPGDFDFEMIRSLH